MFGFDFFGYFLIFFGVDVFFKVWVGVCLGSYNDNGDMFFKKVFDFRGLEIFYVFEWVFIGYWEI